MGEAVLWCFAAGILGMITFVSNINWSLFSLLWKREVPRGLAAPASRIPLPGAAGVSLCITRPVLQPPGSLPLYPIVAIWPSRARYIRGAAPCLMHEGATSGSAQGTAQVINGHSQ